MKASVLTFFRKSQFWKPILQSLSWEQLFFFIVLLGLAPCVADYSLFHIQGLSYMDFLFQHPTPVIGVTYFLPIVLLPIALVILIVKKRPSWILGLLPSVTIAIIELLVLSGHSDTVLFSLILSIASKISFLFFAIAGHTRSLSFLVATVIMAIVLSLQQFILFVVFILVFRFAYLAIFQNLRIFHEISSSSLLKVILKSLLIWSPILLFTIPESYLTQKLDELTQQFIYDKTFVERHHMETHQTMDDLLMFSASDTLSARGYATPVGTQMSQQQSALETALMYVSMKSDSLLYRDYEQATADFERVYSFIRTRQSGSLTPSDLVVLESVKQDLSKVIVERLYPGKSPLELDIELSIHERLYDRENASKRTMDSLNMDLDKQITDSKKSTDQALDDFTRKSDSLAWESEQATIEHRSRLIDATRATSLEFRDRAYQNLTNLQNQASEQIYKMPERSMSLFDKAIPTELTTLCERCEDDDCSLLSIDCHTLNMMKSLLRYMYKQQRSHARIQLSLAADAAAVATDEKVQSLVMGVKNEVDTLAQASVEKVSDLAIHGSEMAVDSMRSALKSVNQIAVRKTAVIRNKIQMVQDTLSAVNTQAKASIEQGFDEARAAVSSSVLFVNHSVEFLKLLSSILLALLIIKSYFYVFSRVAFSEDQDLFISLKDQKKSHANGSLKQCGIEYSIPHGHTETYFVARKFRPTGRAPKLAIPHWTTSVVGRMRAKTYMMNQVSARADSEESVDFRSLAGAEFVEWTLADGEEVVFDYRQFVAMSESVQLTTFMSVRVTSVLFGKLFFPIAKGPGKLVLMTLGRPITNDEERLVKSVHMDRLVAWQKSATFSVDSELNPIDIYLSGLYLKRSSDDIVVIDADEATGNRRIGLAKFIRRFLLPV